MRSLRMHINSLDPAAPQNTFPIEMAYHTMYSGWTTLRIDYITTRMKAWKKTPLLNYNVPSTYRPHQNIDLSFKLR